MLFRVSLAILHVDEKNLLACKDMGALMEEIKRKLDDLNKICKSMDEMSWSGIFIICSWELKLATGNHLLM